MVYIKRLSSVLKVQIVQKHLQQTLRPIFWGQGANLTLVKPN